MAISSFTHLFSCETTSSDDLTGKDCVVEDMADLEEQREGEAADHGVTDPRLQGQHDASPGEEMMMGGADPMVGTDHEAKTDRHTHLQADSQQTKINTNQEEQTEWSSNSNTEPKHEPQGR